jgi:hypothetical protein
VLLVTEEGRGLCLLSTALQSTVVGGVSKQQKMIQNPEEDEEMDEAEEIHSGQGED